MLKLLADANTLIRDGLYIRGTKTYPRKMKVEPRQCMKCRKWGHYAAECMEKQDTCGNCGGEHRTRECTNLQNHFCISCKTNDHASWDRNCPEFLCRMDRMDQNIPENVLKYYPMVENWTYMTPQNNLTLEPNAPAKFAIASLPPR